MLRAAQQSYICLNYDYSAILLSRKLHAGIPELSDHWLPADEPLLVCVCYVTCFGVGSCMYGCVTAIDISRMSMNFDVICRLCMTTGKPLLPLFDKHKTLPLKIKAFAPDLKVS
jgi:hypothetical protein